MTKAVQDLMVEVERVRDAFHAAMFSGTNLDDALGLLAPDCVLVNLPIATGAAEPESIGRFLTGEVRGGLPEDLRFERVTRIGNRWRVVDEMTVRFTHDRPMPWLLPNTAPSGNTVEVLAISLVTVRRSKITSYRTLWDHSTLLDQIHAEPAAPARREHLAS